MVLKRENKKEFSKEFMKNFKKNFKTNSGNEITKEFLEEIKAFKDVESQIQVNFTQVIDKILKKSAVAPDKIENIEKIKELVKEFFKEDSKEKLNVLISFSKKVIDEKEKLENNPNIIGGFYKGSLDYYYGDALVEKILKILIHDPNDIPNSIENRLINNGLSIKEYVKIKTKSQMPDILAARDWRKDINLLSILKNDTTLFNNEFEVIKDSISYTKDQKKKKNQSSFKDAQKTKANEKDATKCIIF